MKKYNIAIVGATGAVGREAVKLLEERNFPVENLRLLARTHDGRSQLFRGSDIQIEELTEKSFQNIDLAIFSAGGDVARNFAPIAVRSGSRVIDNSSAFRMNKEVPLIIPEINGHVLHSGEYQNAPIIANPNCTTAVTLMALWPLHQRYKVKSIIASSYQAVSGTGQKGIDELKLQVHEVVNDLPLTQKVYPSQIAFNVIPQVGSFLETGYTDEEKKLENEGRKIMDHPLFKASITCVRVPVYRAHSVAVAADFEEEEEEVDVKEALEVLNDFPGLKVYKKEGQFDAYPTPVEVAGKNDCYVGRVRKDSVFPNGLSFWVVGDQLLKGAALNAVQIAEELIND